MWVGGLFKKKKNIRLIKSWSQAIGIVTVGIFLSLVRMLGLKQTDWCVQSSVRITFSYRNLHDTTNSTLEIPEVGVQLPEWCGTLHLYVWRYAQVWENIAHTALAPNVGWASGFLWRNSDKQTNNTPGKVKFDRVIFCNCIVKRRKYMSVNVNVEDGHQQQSEQ